jgi:hypothetical protein
MWNGFLSNSLKVSQHGLIKGNPCLIYLLKLNISSGLLQRWPEVIAIKNALSSLQLWPQLLVLTNSLRVQEQSSSWLQAHAFAQQWWCLALALVTGSQFSPKVEAKGRHRHWAPCSGIWHVHPHTHLFYLQTSMSHSTLNGYQSARYQSHLW